MKVTPGKAKYVTVYTSVPKNSTGSIVLTDKNGVVANATSVRLGKSFAEFFIDGSHLTSDKLPVKAELKVGTKTVRSVEFTTNVVSSGGGGSSSWSDITGKPSLFPPTVHDHNSLYFTKDEVESKFDSLPVGGGGGSSDAIKGTGFPEGVVAAPVGTEYVDLDGTNGAIRWVKASGTGNTGWRVVYADTGPRLIGGTFPGMLAGQVYLRRVGHHVTLLVANGNFNNGGNYVVEYNWVPQGFNPTGFVLGILADIGTLNFGKLAITDSNRAVWSNTQTGEFKVGTMDWATSEQWPTTLPGQAA